MQVQIRLLKTVRLLFVIHRLSNQNSNTIRFASTYEDKVMYFEDDQAAAAERREKAATAREQADAYLDNAARIRSSMESIERQNLQRAKEKGLIAQNTSEAEIDDYARKAGMHQQCMHMLNNPPSKEAFGYLDATITSSLREGGATYTDDFGSMRTYNGTQACAQRGNNTRLTNAASLHNTHSQIEQQETNAIDRAIAASLEEPNFLPPPYPISTAATCAAVSSAPSAPSAPSAKIDDQSPAEIVEVRDEAMGEIMLNSESTRQVILGQVVDDLTKPYEKQVVQANNYLHKKGMNPEERLDGVVKFVENREARKKRD